MKVRPPYSRFGHLDPYKVLCDLVNCVTRGDGCTQLKFNQKCTGAYHCIVFKRNDCDCTGVQ